jgi:hypothetical protein
VDAEKGRGVDAEKGRGVNGGCRERQRGGCQHEGVERSCCHALICESAEHERAHAG